MGVNNYRDRVNEGKVKVSEVFKMIQDSSDLSYSYDAKPQSADLSYSYDTKPQHIDPIMENYILVFQQSLDRVAKSNDAVINVASQSWQDATMCVNALCKVLDKILIERQDSKKRKIKLDDNSFRERIGKVEGGGKCDNTLIDEKIFAI